MKALLHIATLTVVLCLALTSLARAQSSRTWVSGVGDDANPCSRTAPCKTFAGAISKTAPFGEINAVDPGGFGTVTITKSITIDGTAQLSGILNSLTNGIIVNAAATDLVTLRRLDINGFGNGTNGIRILAAKRVVIEDCVIYGNGGVSPNGSGIQVATGTTVDVVIRNTVVRNNIDGLNVTTSAGVARVSIVNSAFVGNATGIHARANARITATQSLISANTGVGVFAEGVGGVAVINVSQSQISNNGGNGVQAGGGGSNSLSVVRLNDSDIIQNSGTGALVAASGEIDTWSNNRVIGNGADGCVGCTGKPFN
jgi:hypothetical protein